MKILHMADCHLDSAMETHLPASTAKKRRGELLLTFRAVIERAYELGVSVVLIAGDLFDTPSPQGSTLTYVLSTINDYPDIRFVLIEGNHDVGALRSATLPENLVFAAKGEKKVLHVEDVSVYALGYGADSALICALEMHEGRKNILVAHGTLGNECGDEEIISRAALEKMPIDYLALGHYHSHRAEKLSARCTACYAGVPEGRGFDEAGLCGFVLLDTETMSASFVPAARRTLHRITVDITACGTQRDIENAIHTHTEGIVEGDMVHLTLQGHYRDTLQKDVGQLKTLLGDRFYFAKVKDESTLAIYPEDYKNDVSLRGEFVRAVFAKEMSEEDRSRILTYGLRALCKEDPES